MRNTHKLGNNGCKNIQAVRQRFLVRGNLPLLSIYHLWQLWSTNQSASLWTSNVRIAEENEQLSTYTFHDCVCCLEKTRCPCHGSDKFGFLKGILIACTSHYDVLSNRSVFHCIYVFFFWLNEHNCDISFWCTHFQPLTCAALQHFVSAPNKTSMLTFWHFYLLFWPWFRAIPEEYSYELTFLANFTAYSGTKTKSVSLTGKMTNSILHPICITGHN